MRGRRQGAIQHDGDPTSVPPNSPYSRRVLRKRRFADVIARQLDLFEREEAELLADVEAARRAYDRADRDEAEELYATVAR